MRDDVIGFSVGLLRQTIAEVVGFSQIVDDIETAVTDFSKEVLK